jgi:hypothetical protein
MMSTDMLTPMSEQDEIRLQIDESRAALAEKLEMLEEKVAETVQNASSSVAEATASVVDTVNNATASVSETVANVNAAVQGTVENVRSSVSNTVESVRDTFDLPEQVRKYPWAMLAGAVVAGYAGGRYFQPEPKPAYQPSGVDKFLSSSSSQPTTTDSIQNLRSEDSATPEYSTGTRGAGTSGNHITKLYDQPKTNYLMDTFGSEIAKLRGLAIGVSLGLVRDMVSDSAPPAFKEQISEVFDGFTDKLGGERIRGPILPATHSS